MTISIRLLLWLAAALAAAPGLAGAKALTIDTAIRDMQRPNEAIPIKPTFDFQRRPSIIQYSPEGSVLPSWWRGNRPEWCYRLLTWYTAYEAGGPDGSEEGANTATNTRIQVRNLRAYILWESGKWTRVDQVPGPKVGLWQYPFKKSQRPAGARREAGQGNSIKPDYPNFHHGYGSTYVLENPRDVRAVFVAMDFRLVRDDPTLPDDRSEARYIVNVGADYYPGPGQNWGVDYAPGVGSGRYLLASKEWRTATMLVPNTKYGMTFDRLRKNPPPGLQPAGKKKKRR